MILALLVGAGCASKKSLSGVGGGGGARPASTKPGPLLVEVRGYVLAPSASVPPDAIGYAVPIFTSREQAKNFCGSFIGRLSFGGRLDSNVKLQVRTYGQTVQIAPFVWPVTSWTTGDKADCVSLVARYNLSGARIFYKLAVDAIRANGGRPSDALSQGPFIVTARRVSGTTMIYDLSRAPDNDYEKWLVRAAEQLTDPSWSRQTYVTPRWRDRMRYYVFGSISTFQGIVDVLIPGFSKEHERI
jgi:hypothetical protein